MLRTSLALLAVLAALLFGAPLVGRLLGADPDLSALPPPARKVEIGGSLALNVAEWGSGTGTPIVLVHGLPSSLGDWGDLPERLAARGHRVVAYDRIGYGWSSRASAEDPAAYRYESNARQLLALLDALEIERAALVGWSYGGGVVQVLAAAHPERVARLALVASVGPALAPGSDPLAILTRSPLGLPLFEWVASVTPLARAVLRGPLAEAFSGAANVPPGWGARTLAQLALPGTVAAWVREEQRHDVSLLHPERIAARTLVLHGSDDHNVPFAVGEDLARRLPDAELVAIEGGSHVLPATHAELLAEQLHAWMGGRRR